jgi:DNA-binding LytR/AlgR family response regulator
MDGHYVIYHTKEGDLKEYATLKEACGKLQRSFFVFANRSCLVNLFYVTSVSRDSVMLGNDRIDISRPQKKVFLNAVSEFMGGGR